jgi:hypothetical protein
MGYVFRDVKWRPLQAKDQGYRMLVGLHGQCPEKGAHTLLVRRAEILCCAGSSKYRWCWKARGKNTTMHVHSIVS